jgi:hypothetical protein
MSGKAKVLVFGFTPEEEQRVDSRLAEMGAPPAAKMRPGHGEVLLERIIEEGAQGQGSFDSPERLVLFHNISDGGVLALMRALRGLELGRPLFAVVTATSIRWTLAALVAHLVRERAALESGQGESAG